MLQELNVFDQYEHTENRLSHALGITLDRAKEFRTIFLKEFTGQSQPGSDAKVILQMAGGTAEINGEKCGIPDLAIIDEKNDQGVIMEVKVGAPLTWQQLASHERRAERNALEVLAALAITGRDKDRLSIETWNREKRFSQPWRHVSWQEIYELACRHAHLNPWVKELRDYMQIMATKLNENEMGADVKIVTFTGITQEMIDNYTPMTAKRVMRSLMDELRADKVFLKDIGIPVNQPPRNRKAIKTSVRVWDFLSPLADDDAFTKSHHFTVGLNPDRLDAFLTIPNACFGKFRAYAKSATIEEFADIVEKFVSALNRSGVTKAGGRPFIVIVQRRFRVMKHYATDGLAEFDLRTWSGAAYDKSEPEIKRQPEWLEFCHKLVTERQANIQFQIGARFYFESCPALQGKKALDLIKDTFRASLPIAQISGYAKP